LQDAKSVPKIVVAAELLKMLAVGVAMKQGFPHVLASESTGNHSYVAHVDVVFLVLFRRVNAFFWLPGYIIDFHSLLPIAASGDLSCRYFYMYRRWR